MRKFFTYHEEHPSDLIYGTMTVFSLLLVAFGFVCGHPLEIVRGVITICRTPAGLITDSIMIGGLGAAFVNAGLVTLISVLLLRVNKLAFSGISVACLFLMAGFSLFGKDILNIWPILFGSFLYARIKRERFARYLYTSLFATALSPVVTEFSIIADGHPQLQLILMLSIGILIGFVLPPLATYTLRIHQGYNLYNVGFAAGLVGMVIASLCKSMGYAFEAKEVWSSGNNILLGYFLGILFMLMIIAGYFYNGRSFNGWARLMRHSGRAMADFVVLDQYPVVLINMGIVGLMATAYVLLVGGALNGPTLGGIFTVCGFGAFGKHPKNIWAPVVGVALPSLLAVWNLNDPSVLLAALFSTALAPIAGQFGWRWGVLAGVIHSSVVLNVSALHGGLNLYNNGFSAGLVCIVLLPLIEGLQRDKED